MHDMTTTRSGRRGWRALAAARWAALALLLTAIAGACGGDDAPEVSAAERAENLVSEIPAPADDAIQVDDTFVGLTEDGAIAVALVVKDGAAVAYICDGKELGHWFKGSANDGEIDLEHAAGTRIRAEIGDDQAAGEVTLADGSQLAFTAPKAEGDFAGLFRSTDLKAGFVHGWIVVPTGADLASVRGLGREPKTKAIDAALVVDDVVPSEEPAPPKKEIELSEDIDIGVTPGQFTCDQLKDSFDAVAFAADHATSNAVSLGYVEMGFQYIAVADAQGCTWQNG